MAAWSAYTNAMIETGVVRSGNALKPGFDAALQWAARSPAASYGAVEARPMMSV